MGSQRVRHNWATNTLTQYERKKYNYLYLLILFSWIQKILRKSQTHTHRHSCACMISCVWLLWRHRLQPVRLYFLWKFPGKDTGVGCHFLLQRIFPTQGSNLRLCLLHWRVDSPPGKPRCGAQASNCDGFCCGTWALGARASVVVARGL